MRKYIIATHFPIFAYCLYREFFDIYLSRDWCPEIQSRSSLITSNSSQPNPNFDVWVIRL